MSAGSSQRAKRNARKRRNTTAPSSAKTETDWAALDAMTDEEIRAQAAADPDVAPVGAEFWKEARLVWPENKGTITIRLDADVLRFFRKERGYQTKINAILRSYVQAHTKGDV